MALAVSQSASKKENEVAKPELGKKRTCLSCGAKFYDLAKDPIVCPKCETVLDLAALTRPTRSKPAPAPKAEKPAPTDDEIDLEADDDEDFEDDDVVLDDDDDEDDKMLEDASELGEDKDDIFEVIDTVEEKQKDEDT
jgi:uncharacterized protein (TIGR02300 family)